MLTEKQKSFLNGRAAAADFMRVVSIVVVAWYHFWQQSWLNPNFELFGTVIDIYPLIRCGYMFVYNMILVSGFVLMLSRLNGRYTSIWHFYKSRLVRILPSYLFCIVVFLFISNMKGGTYDWFDGRQHMKVDLLAHLTFTQNLFPQAYTGTGLNVALWTVAVEMQFYLFFPFLSWAFEKKPALTYLSMVVLSFLSKLYVQIRVEDSTLYINRLPAMLDVFANGMLGAYLYQRLRKTRQFGILHLVLSVSACAGIYLLIRDISYISGGEEQRMAQMWGASLLSVYGGVFLVSGSLAYESFKRIVSLLISAKPLRFMSGLVGWLLTNPLLRFLSGISYNFYIWHQPIAVWLKQLHIPFYTEEYPNMSGNVDWQQKYMLLCIVCALIAAFRATYLIEKPCARWLSSHRVSDLKKLFKRNKPAAEENVT